MATIDSTLVANAVATPRVASPVAISGARVRHQKCAFEVTAAQMVNGNIFRLARLPSNARVSSIKIGNDELDSHGTPTVTFDVGVYDTLGTDKDSDCYATSSTQLQSAAALTELRYEAATANVDKVEKQLWEDAGYSEDPGGMLDICLTLDAAVATAAAGTLAFIIEYTID